MVLQRTIEQFTTIADEVTDVAKLSVINYLWYVDSIMLTVREDLVGFFECDTGISGLSLSDVHSLSLALIGLLFMVKHTTGPGWQHGKFSQIIVDLRSLCIYNIILWILNIISGIKPTPGFRKKVEINISIKDYTKKQANTSATNRLLTMARKRGKEG